MNPPATKPAAPSLPGPFAPLLPSGGEKGTRGKGATSSAGGAFASAMRQALDRKTDAAAPGHPRSLKHEGGQRGKGEVGKRRTGAEEPFPSAPFPLSPSTVLPAQPAPSEANDVGTKDEATEVTDDAGTDDAATTEEETKGEAAMQVSNIILFPDPSVIIPFPMALVSGGPAGGQAFSACAGTQPDSGNAPVEGSGSSNEPSGENIVPLPTGPQPTELRLNAGASADANRGPASGDQDDEDAGIDILKLGLRPTRREERAENIEAVDFKQADRGTTAGEKLGKWESGTETEPSSSHLPTSSPAYLRSLPPTLPSESADPENSARSTEVGEVDPNTSPSRPNPGKAPASTALTSAAPPPAGPAQPTGIPAARQEGRMNTLMDTRHERAHADRSATGSVNSNVNTSNEVLIPLDFSPRTPAIEWQSGRPVGSIGPSASEFSTQEVDAAGTVERISNLITLEVALVRQYKSDAMAVVLRPDADTELFVHFTQRNGQIEATIRCERGDTQQLGALWSQLQESLGQQKVRLAPLQESPSNHSHFNSSAGSQSGGGNNSSPRQTPDKRFMDDWSVPASSASDSPHGRGRAGSGHRRLTTSRPGWETWA